MKFSDLSETYFSHYFDFDIRSKLKIIFMHGDIVYFYKNIDIQCHHKF